MTHSLVGLVDNRSSFSSSWRTWTWDLQRGNVNKVKVHPQVFPLHKLLGILQWRKNCTCTATVIPFLWSTDGWEGYDCIRASRLGVCACAWREKRKLKETFQYIYPTLLMWALTIPSCPTSRLQKMLTFVADVWRGSDQAETPPHHQISCVPGENNRNTFPDNIWINKHM